MTNSPAIDHAKAKRDLRAKHKAVRLVRLGIKYASLNGGPGFIVAALPSASRAFATADGFEALEAMPRSAIMALMCRPRAYFSAWRADINAVHRILAVRPEHAIPAVFRR